MKKLIVKDDICIGCGACVAIDSNHFDFDDQGLSSVISQDNLETDEVKNAINSCPVSAIKLVDDEKNDCSCEECDNDCEGHCDCKE